MNAESNNVTYNLRRKTRRTDECKSNDGKSTLTTLIVNTIILIESYFLQNKIIIFKVNNSIQYKRTGYEFVVSYFYIKVISWRKVDFKIVVNNKTPIPTSLEDVDHKNIKNLNE